MKACRVAAAQLTEEVDDVLFPVHETSHQEPVAQRRALSYHEARFSSAPLAGLNGGCE